MCSSGQVDAIDTIRDLLGVESVHAIGYCVAGTTLAATLAYLHAKGEAGKVKSATFFTAQVDFSEAGDLKLFLGDETMGLLEQLTAEKGYLDGRYMAATFNLLRGRDLIWSYVVNNYLLGEEPAPFDLLHWNSDTTNLPAGWHRDYLETLYKGNKLAEKGGISVAGTADRHRRRSRRRPTSRPGARTISRRRRACGRSWTISPGRKRFVLAGSGHIAGRGQSAGGSEISVLDQRRADATTLRRVRRRRKRAQGQLVAGLARLAQEAGLGDGQGRGRADSRQGQAQGDRGRAGRYVKAR